MLYTIFDAEMCKFDLISAAADDDDIDDDDGDDDDDDDDVLALIRELLRTMQVTVKQSCQFVDEREENLKVVSVVAEVKSCTCMNAFLLSQIDVCSVKPGLGRH